MRFESYGDIKLHDSGGDSRIELLFVPGFGGPVTWKHQLKYFSDCFRTLTFRTEKRDLESQTEAARKILNRKNLENVVLVASDVGNFVVREHGRRENVSANILTGFTGDIPETGEYRYRITAKALKRKPKLAKKVLFSQNTDYSVARDLCEDLEPMQFEELESYREADLRPLKNALYIRGRDDRFSSDSDRRSLEPDVSFRKLSGGSLCFYEKPEEFNKAVYDFVQRLADFMESREIRERRENNRSLDEYRQSSLEVDTKRW
ncbi:MAG: alpha/beta fold hydrolase [Candidatus Nanohaloarchaea archaeon]